MEMPSRTSRLRQLPGIRFLPDIFIFCTVIFLSEAQAENQKTELGSRAFGKQVSGSREGQNRAFISVWNSSFHALGIMPQKPSETLPRL